MRGPKVRPTLTTQVDPHSCGCKANRDACAAALQEVDKQLARARKGEGRSRSSAPRDAHDGQRTIPGPVGACRRGLGRSASAGPPLGGPPRRSRPQSGARERGSARGVEARAPRARGLDAARCCDPLWRRSKSSLPEVAAATGRAAPWQGTANPAHAPNPLKRMGFRGCSGSMRLHQRAAIAKPRP